MWRSLPNLLPNEDTTKVKSKYADNAPAFKPAATVTWVGELAALDYLDPAQPIRMRMVSMLYGAQNSSYADILSDSLQISALLMSTDGEVLRSIARTAIKRTEEVDYALRIFNNNIVFAVSGDAAKDTNEVQSQFYFAVDLPFRSWLSALSTATSPDDLLQVWNRQLRTTALKIAEQILSNQPPAVWAGRMQDSTRITGPVAMNRLTGALYRVLGPATPRDRTNEERLDNG